MAPSWLEDPRQLLVKNKIQRQTVSASLIVNAVKCNDTYRDPPQGGPSHDLCCWQNTKPLSPHREAELSKTDTGGLKSDTRVIRSPSECLISKL